MIIFKMSELLKLMMKFCKNKKCRLSIESLHRVKDYAERQCWNCKTKAYIIIYNDPSSSSSTFFLNQDSGGLMAAF